MQEEDSGNRIKHLGEVLKAICQVYQVAREDGIPHVEFLNSEGAEDITDDLVDELVDIDWVGITPIGTMLKAKVLDPLVFDRQGLGKMQKPLIVITITDGDVSTPARAHNWAHQSRGI